MESAKGWTLMESTNEWILMESAEEWTLKKLGFFYIYIYIRIFYTLRKKK